MRTNNLSAQWTKAEDIEDQDGHELDLGIGVVIVVRCRQWTETAEWLWHVETQDCYYFNDTDRYATLEEAQVAAEAGWFLFVMDMERQGVGEPIAEEE